MHLPGITIASHLIIIGFTFCGGTTHDKDALLKSVRYYGHASKISQKKAMDDADQLMAKYSTGEWSSLSTDEQECADLVKQHLAREAVAFIEGVYADTIYGTEEMERMLTGGTSERDVGRIVAYIDTEVRQEIETSEASVVSHLKHTSDQLQRALKQCVRKS